MRLVTPCESVRQLPCGSGDASSCRRTSPSGVEWLRNRGGGAPATPQTFPSVGAIGCDRGRQLVLAYKPTKPDCTFELTRARARAQRSGTRTRTRLTGSKLLTKSDLGIESNRYSEIENTADLLFRQKRVAAQSLGSTSARFLHRFGEYEYEHRCAEQECWLLWWSPGDPTDVPISWGHWMRSRSTTCSGLQTNKTGLHI